MSKSTNRAQVEDLWTKIEALPEQTIDDSVDTTTIFVGDSACGKSSLIQTFLKPSVTKEPKPTFALEYNFARKKGSSGQTTSKSVAHIWELGGDISEPKLLDVAITARALAGTSVVICCDLSKPQNVLASLKKWITLVRDVIKRRFAELKALNPNEALALRDNSRAPYEEHANDVPRVKPCEVPLYIIANKFDLFKTKTLGERRAVFQLIRFIAHLHGATVFTTASTEAGMKDSLRNMMSSICFRSGQKAACETAIDKPVFVTAGRDDFAQILLSSLVDTTVGKSRLLGSEADLSHFLSAQGLLPEAWSRFSDHLAATFGHPDPAAEQSGSGDVEERKEDNEFPETEVDEMRAQRDIALHRYIQESERREALFAKLNAPEGATA